MMHPGELPLVYVLILNWNRRDDTVECLESLRAVKFPRLATVVVDNGSTDGSVCHIRDHFPEVTVIENRVNLGFAGGNNVGIQYALKMGADAVLLLNNDTIVAPDFVDELVRVCATDPRIGMCGSTILYYSRRTLLWYAGGTWWNKKCDFIHEKMGDPYDSAICEPFDTH